MRARLLVFVVLLGIAAVIIGWIYESRWRETIERADLVIPDDIDYFLTDLHYRAMNEHGELDYEFRSRRLEHRRLTDTSDIEQPALEIYRDGEHWQVDANRGEYRHRENLLDLEQRVVMRRLGARPLRLESDLARFEPDLDRLTMVGNLVLESDTAEIRADGAELDLADGVYRFDNTRAIYHDDDQG